MEDDKITYYEHSRDLIDNSVIDKTRRFWPHGTVVFYAQKRHYLEIIPEFVSSLLLSLAVLAFGVWMQPWEWFGDSPLVSVLWGVLVVLAWTHFAVELVRWNREFIVLTNRGLFNPHFKIMSLDHRNPRVDWITKSNVTKPLVYKLSGVDVGTLVFKDPGGVMERTPAVAYPHSLHALIPVADEFRPPADKMAAINWRN
jgi:hypothetical protein